MPKNTVILILGVLVLITPYLGIPSAWKTVVFVVTGIFIIIIWLSMRRDEDNAALAGGRKTETFIENGNRVGAGLSGDEVVTTLSGDDKDEQSRDKTP